MQKLSKRYVSLAIWYPMDGRTDRVAALISLQTIPWMDARCWIITEPGSSWSFALEMESSMQESPIVSQPTSESLHFHFNASLAAITLAKAACKRLGMAFPYPPASHSYTMLICLNYLFACLGLAQTRKLLTNFSKNSFYLLPEPLRLGEFLTNYCILKHLRNLSDESLVEQWAAKTLIISIFVACKSSLRMPHVPLQN